MPTIQSLYDQILSEYREVSSHYQGRLDALHHLIAAGLGHHEVPESQEAGAADSLAPDPDSVHPDPS